MWQIMDKSISINYSEKEQAMIEASNVMEHALKTIADLFKNIQAENLSLVNHNNRLQLSVRELSEQKNECTVCRRKSIREDELPNCSKTIQEQEKENVVETCRDMATPGIIESTQIEERVLIKPKSRHLDKRSNYVCDENKIYKASTSTSTQPKRHIGKKHSHVAKVSAEIVLTTSSKVSHRDKDNLQSVDEKTDGIIHENCKNNTELDPEYLDIDATLFEQPFSQEQSPDKKAQASCEVDETETLKDTLEKTRAKSFLDDVVEVSPKKDVLRKKHWLRHNRYTAKTSLINPTPDLEGTSKADNNDKDVCTQKSSKYMTSKDKEEEKNEDVAIIETKARTPKSKIDIFSSRIRNKKVSSAVTNESNIFSLPTAEITATALTFKPNAQVATVKDKNDITATKTLIRTQSIEPSSDETYFAADETYFLDHDIPSRANSNKKNEETFNKAKRKFADIAVSSDMEKNINPRTSELEMDIGDMSDWDTDISCDKWSSTTPQKRALVNSFDIVAVKNIAPKFATKGPVVRNKLERAKLRGWDCENCAQYYENMGLSEKELAERKNRCSRHRSKFNERFYTPPGLWDLRFPDTQSSSQE